MAIAPTSLPDARKLLERSVDRWLRDEGAVYEREIRMSQFSRERLDVLITLPFPLVLELKVLREEQFIGPILPIAKELLAKRISVAQKFGKYMPFVAIVMMVPRVDTSVRGMTVRGQRRAFDPAKFLTRRVPAFDAVFTPEDLPSLISMQELPLNPRTLRILELGAPSNVDLTSEAEVERRWAESISLSMLLNGHDFQKNTIADIARQRLMDRPNITEIKGKGRITRAGSDVGARNRVLAYSMVGDAISSFLSQQGLVKLDRSSLRAGEADADVLLPGNVQIWEGVSRRVFGLRMTTAVARGSRGVSFPRDRELLSEAWLIRAFAQVPPSDLIMLLGIDSERPPDTYAVNSLEAAGWSVFPWDFAKPVPEFMAKLREIGVA